MEKKKFKLIEHPWLFLVVFIFSYMVCNTLVAVLWTGIFKLPGDKPLTGTLIVATTQLLLLFVVVPFVLGFPRRPLSYAKFLSEIRLSQMRPLLKLILLGVSCWLIMGICQIVATFIFRLSQGQAIDLAFIGSNFRIADEFPPRSFGFLGSSLSVFEEIAWRGVMLTLFLRFYSQPKAILFTALGFGAMHILSLLDGREPIWVAGNVMWAVMLGLFYGYITIKSGSLLPAILIHYLSNLFIWPLTAYLQDNSSTLVIVLYGITLTMGAIPVVLMWLWTRTFISRWMVTPQTTPAS